MTRFQINPGEFRHIVIFQKKLGVQNSYGEISDEWTDFLKTRAGIYPVSGKEFFAAETVNSELTHKVHLRFLPGITPDMRIKFGNRFFTIISVINYQEKNIELQIICKEVI